MPLYRFETALYSALEVIALARNTTKSSTSMSMFSIQVSFVEIEVEFVEMRLEFVYTIELLNVHAFSNACQKQIRGPEMLCFSA